MKIRRALIEDAEVIHKLSWQLGYSPDLDTVRNNIKKMLNHQDYDLMVATGDENMVIGWMTLALRIRIEDVSFLQVAGLVTDERIRGKGAGKLLMSYATKVAKERNLPFVGLYSSKSRTETHAFYEHIGYSRAKESFFFRKDANA